MIKQQGRLLHKDKEFTSSAILKKKGPKVSKLGRISSDSRNREQNCETSFPMASLKAHWGVHCTPPF